MTALADANPALVEGLRVAVPLRIAELQQLHGAARADQVRWWASGAVEPIASRGDALQFGGKKGEAAGVFNHLAKGLAALAHCPGGVLFAGTHWCVEHQWGLSCSSRTELPCTASGIDPVRPRRPVETVTADILSGGTP